MKLADMFVTDIKNEGWERYDPVCRPVEAEFKGIAESELDLFDSKVFNYLHRNKKELGVEKLYALKYVPVDGLLILDDGRTVVLEIKHALNWFTSCNARVEIARFLVEKRLPNFTQPERALIIFEHFSAPWKRKKIGWGYFYEEESVLRNKFPPIPVDIAQLTEAGLKGVPQMGSTLESGFPLTDSLDSASAHAIPHFKHV